MDRECIVHARINQVNNAGDGYDPVWIDGIRTDNGRLASGNQFVTRRENVYDRIKSNGGVTVAVLKNEDGTLSWGFAKCSSLDTYNKKVGRAIAKGRASHRPIVTEDAEYEVIRETALHLARAVDCYGSNSGDKLTDFSLVYLEEVIIEKTEEKSKIPQIG